MVKAYRNAEERAVLLGLAMSRLSISDFHRLHLLDSRSQRFGSLERQLRDGREILHVMKLLGHKSIKNTADLHPARGRSKRRRIRLQGCQNA